MADTQIILLQFIILHAANFPLWLCMHRPDPVLELEPPLLLRLLLLPLLTIRPLPLILLPRQTLLAPDLAVVLEPIDHGTRLTGKNQIR